MHITQAKDLVNQKFKYQADGKLDTWTILNINGEKIKGDCEDYSLTFMWLAEDKNIFKFLLAIVLMKYVIWYAKTPTGEGHAITYNRVNGMFIDNIKQDFNTKDKYIQDGFKFIFPFLSIMVFVKLLISYTIGRFIN